MPHPAPHRVHRPQGDPASSTAALQALDQQALRPETLGPLVLTTRLDSLTIAERWAAVDRETGVASLAYRLHERPLPRALARLRGRVNDDRPHLLSIRAVHTDESRHVWLVCPYLGDASGVLTLESAMRRQGEALPAIEAAHAVAHIRAALSSLRAAKLAHPNLTLDQLIVCPRGSLHIELPGVATILDEPAHRDASTPLADDRVAAHLAAQILTGDTGATARTLRERFRRRQRPDVVDWAMKLLNA
ncbi:MAG: hypothetical protein RLN60_03105 [Phycisphaerales bacterium]